MELETINKLFLELSQFSTARTEREIAWERRVTELMGRLEDQEGRIDNSDTEKLRRLRMTLTEIADKAPRINSGDLVKRLRRACKNAK